jgi:hypothetical protein
MAGWSHRTGDEWRLTLNWYADLWEQYQDLAAGMRAIREAVEHAFGATLPPTATLNDELEIITRAIHVIGRRSMPSYSPELIQTMRAALDEVMTKIPPEQATAALKRTWLSAS